MEENLVGYLLDALDADERRDVEQYLREQPGARRQLEVLRQALAPLEADRVPVEPPAGLCERTLARACEGRGARGEGREPKTLHLSPRIGGLSPLAPRPSPLPSWWRRADVLVAATLLLCVTLLLPPGLSYLRFRSDLATCQNNLREFYDLFHDYGDRHNGELPNVTTVKAPAKVAGLVVPVLMQESGKGPSINCPAGGQRSPRLATLEELRRMDRQEFERYAAELLGGYGYSLGYRDADGVYRVHRLDPNEGDLLAGMPLMSDGPPLRVESGDPSNSPNHWGRGQNVLYGDGSCRFCTHRNVGPDQDDIFTNWRKRVAAGANHRDAVLGGGGAQP